MTWFFSSKQDQDRQKQLAQQRLVTWQQKDQSELSKVKEQLKTLETEANSTPVSSASIGALQVCIKGTVHAVRLFDSDPCPNPFRFLNLQTSIRTPAVQNWCERNLVDYFLGFSLPCEQRLHFRCASCRAKSILCRQPFKSVQKSGWINLKKRALSCLAWQIRVVAIFLFRRNSRHLTTDLRVNFACESRDEFRACPIENWTVVGRGYFSHSSPHIENAAFARRVLFHKNSQSKLACKIAFNCAFAFATQFNSYVKENDL